MGFLLGYSFKEGGEKVGAAWHVYKVYIRKKLWLFLFSFYGIQTGNWSIVKRLHLSKALKGLYSSYQP